MAQMWTQKNKLRVHQHIEQAHVLIVMHYEKYDIILSMEDEYKI